MLTINKNRIGLALVSLSTVLIVVFSLSFTVEGQDEMSGAEEILNLERQWSAKCSGGGEGALDWIVDLHADSAVQLPPGGDIVQGKEALRVAWNGMVNTEGLDISWEPTKAFVSESGDMAYDYGMAKIKNPDGSIVNAKYLVVWSKIDGEWKIVADAFNMNGSGTK